MKHEAITEGDAESRRIFEEALAAAGRGATEMAPRISKDLKAWRMG